MEIHVDLERVRANARAVRGMVPGAVTGVAKGVDAFPPVVEAMVEAGIERIAVSRPADLERFASMDVELLMVRVPAISELPQVVAHADVALHGSREVIEAAASIARRRGETHAVIPMVDVGDGREGIARNRIEACLDDLDGRPGIRCVAIGINVGCFGTRPDVEALGDAIDGLPNRALSVGGSALLPWCEDLPGDVRDVRVGDAILTGRWLNEPLAGLEEGAFELHAEVLKAGDGESVLDFGSVTTAPSALRPPDGITIDRWSTEQAVIARELSVGETLAFGMDYPAMARSFGWRHVDPVVHG